MQNNLQFCAWAILAAGFLICEYVWRDFDNRANNQRKWVLDNSNIVVIDCVSDVTVTARGYRTNEVRLIPYDKMTLHPKLHEIWVIQGCRWSWINPTYEIKLVMSHDDWEEFKVQWFKQHCQPIKVIDPASLSWQ